MLTSLCVCSFGIVQGSTRLTFKIATRGLLGLKNALLSATRGMGLLNTLFDCYRPVAGNISMRENGSLVAFETGQVSQPNEPRWTPSLGSHGSGLNHLTVT